MEYKFLSLMQLDGQHIDYQLYYDLFSCKLLLGSEKIHFFTIQMCDFLIVFLGADLINSPMQLLRLTESKTVFGTKHTSLPLTRLPTFKYFKIIDNFDEM